MKIIPKPPIFTRLRKLINEAQQDNVDIDHIELNKFEFDQLVEACKPYLRWEHPPSKEVEGMFDMGGLRLATFEGYSVREVAE